MKYEPDRGITKERWGPSLDMKDKKDIEGKPLPLLMPYEAIVAYSKASDDGFKNLGNRDTWKHNDPKEGYIKYANAAARHLFKLTFEDRDEKSNLPHIYPAVWNICAAVWHYERINK